MASLQKAPENSIAGAALPGVSFPQMKICELKFLVGVFCMPIPSKCAGVPRSVIAGSLKKKIKKNLN